MKRKIKFDRLQKLADHLKSGKLGHKKFDFNNYNIGRPYNNFDAKGCGFAGCAIGELPFVFPKLWRFNNADISFFRFPRLRRNTFNNTSSDGEEFFNINSCEYQHLFVPSCADHVFQDILLYGGRILKSGAKPKSVAKNIEAFIKKMKEGKS